MQKEQTLIDSAERAMMTMTGGAKASTMAQKLLYYLGCCLSLLVGAWHFFVPYMFQWFSYISGEYENLVVGITYTNYFFALLLTGLSLLLIVFGKRVIAGNRDWLIVFGFFVFIWLNRAAITFIIPWPLEPIAWAAYAQQITAIVIFVSLLLSFVLMKRRKPSVSADNGLAYGRGSMKDKMWVADDFDAPLDDFKEYTE